MEGGHHSVHSQNMTCKSDETLRDTLDSNLKILCKKSGFKSGTNEKLCCKTLQLHLIPSLKQDAMESIKMQRKASGTTKH